MKDVFSLHRSASEAIVNLLERFFSLERAAAVLGIEVYKRFMTQTDKVIGMHAETKKLPENTYGPYPDIQAAPPSLLSALEEYVNQISNKDGQIPLTTNADYNRDVGAFAGLSGLSSLGAGSFALAPKQLDQVLLKIEKMEKTVKEGTASVLQDKAKEHVQYCMKEVHRLEDEVAERKKALDTLRGGGFFGFGGKKKDDSEVQREEAASSAFEIAQKELNAATVRLNQAKENPMDSLRNDAEDRVAAELKELKELIVQVAAAANESVVKLQVKADALEANKSAK